MTDYDETKLHKLTLVRKCEDKEGYVQVTLSGSSEGVIKLCVSEDTLKEEVERYFRNKM